MNAEKKLLLFALCLTMTSIGVGVEIREMRVPPVVESGSKPHVILECNYDLTEQEATQMDIKWFFGDNPQPFFQWIPGHAPQTIGELFRGRIDLSYEANSAEGGKGRGKYHKHRALKILRPTTELSGTYKCKVSSLMDEDFMTKQMVVYCTWTRDHDLVLTMIAEGKSDEVLDAALVKLPEKTVDAFHPWRDACYNLLMHSVETKNHAGFKMLRAYGADVTLGSDRGTTVMHMMAKRGLTMWARECVEAMEQKQRIKFLNSGTRYGWTPLMAAAESNNFAFARFLVHEGADVNVKMWTGWTALHTATKKGHKDIMYLLFKNGADKAMPAKHNAFGSSCECKDVTDSPSVLELLDTFGKDDVQK